MLTASILCHRLDVADRHRGARASSLTLSLTVRDRTRRSPHGPGMHTCEPTTDYRTTDLREEQKQYCADPRSLSGVLRTASERTADHELQDSIEQPARWRAHSGRFSANRSRPGCSS